MNEESMFDAMREAVVSGDKIRARTLAEEALGLGIDPARIMEKGYIPGIQKVGDLWEEGEYFLPELITSAACMKEAMEVLRPALLQGGRAASPEGAVVIGTVEGDIHDIGKNLVAAMLQANGFEVHDLGADVKLERFIAEAEEKKADIICLSALLTTTMLNQKRLIGLLADKGLRDRYGVLVGGAPVTRAWAEQIGADGFGANAPDAVRAAKTIATDVKKRREHAGRDIR
jgi:corrinoid protein of di/trimethylamine methyltransferase